MPKERTRWAWLLATGLGIGYLRPGPGTWASAATVIAWWAIARSIPAVNWAVALGLAALVSAMGIPAATRAARESGQHDPSFVVIDEVAGQLIALIGVPLVWKSLFVSFILFRAFDIVKPPPVRQLERLPEGSGIVLDDVMAGLYALIAVQALLRFKLL